MKWLAIGLLILGVVSLLLGSGAVLYLLVRSAPLSVAVWLVLGLIVAVWTLKPLMQSAYLQIKNLVAVPVHSFSLTALISNKELVETLEYLAALLLLLSLLAWALERF